MRRGPVIAVLALAVGLANGALAGVWWGERRADDVPDGQYEFLRVLVPLDDRVVGPSLAVAMAVGEVRADGTTYGEWVKARLIRLCPGWTALHLSFAGVVNVNGDGTGYVEVSSTYVRGQKVPGGSMCGHLGPVAWVRGPEVKVVDAAQSPWLGEFRRGDAA